MERTEGLVIKCRDYSETSQLVWFYTRDFGKIKVIAKGSRKKAKIDLFNFCDIVFYKGRGELHILKECTVLEVFTNLRQDLRRIATASYVAEFLDVYTGLEDPNSEIYLLLKEIIRCLNEGKDPDFLRYYFEIKLMQFSGILPDLGGVSNGVKRILESKIIDKLKVLPRQLEELKRLSIDFLGDKRLKSLDFLEKGGV